MHLFQIIVIKQISWQRLTHTCLVTSHDIFGKHRLRVDKCWIGSVNACCFDAVEVRHRNNNPDKITASHRYAANMSDGICDCIATPYLLFVYLFKKSWKHLHRISLITFICVCVHVGVHVCEAVCHLLENRQNEKRKHVCIFVTLGNNITYCGFVFIPYS